MIKIEIGNQLDGSLDNFARRFWEHLGTEANGLINDALTGKDPITELVYSDRYVCSPLVVNLLVSVIHELGRLSDADFAIRILGRQYQRETIARLGSTGMTGTQLASAMRPSARLWRTAAARERC